MASGQGQYRPGGAGGPGGAASGGAGSFAAGPGGDQNSPAGGGGSLEEAIPGVPGEDYPIFSVVPETSFLCDGQVDGGYYGDPEAECQSFHICAADGTGGLTKYSFLCPNGTLFNQQYFICDWWFNVDCSLTTDLYYLNEEVAAEREANSPAGGGDGYSGGGGSGGARGGAGGGSGQRGGGGAGGQRGGGPSRSSSGAGSRGSSSIGSGGQGSYKGSSPSGGAGGLTRSRGSGGAGRGSSAGGRGSGGGGQGSNQGGRGGVQGGRGGVQGGRGGVPGGRGGGRNGAGSRGGSSPSPAGQPGYGSTSGGSSGDDYDYDGSAIGSVIPGYGAPGSDGGFPPLNSYTRKSRQLDASEVKEIDVEQIIQDLEIETGAEILEDEY